MADTTTAKEVGKKARKADKSDAQKQTGQDWQGGYGIDYFGDSPAVKHAQEQSIKAKALTDIRKIYAESGAEIPQATLNVTDQDVAAYKALQDLEYLRDFDNMVGKSYLEKGDPAMIKWVADVYPEIFDKRAAEIDKILAIQKKIAMLKILGPRSKEDLLFEYELGVMKERNKDKWNLIHKPVTEGVGSDTKFTRGVLSLPEIFASWPKASGDRIPTSTRFAGGAYTKMLYGGSTNL